MYFSISFDIGCVMVFMPIEYIFVRSNNMPIYFAIIC